MANTFESDLGKVTAYAYAVDAGYQGTEAEFEEDLLNAVSTFETDKTLSVSDKAADAKSVGDALALKQDALTFDSTPTENSTNPVTSGGVYAAESKQAYDSDKYYPQKNLLESPILGEFMGSAPGASIVEADDCNIVVLANAGSSTRCNLRLKSTINNKIYILVCAKKLSEGTTLLNISAGVSGSDPTLLGRITLTSEFVYYNLEYDLTLTDVNYVRFTNPSANTTLQFTCVVVSDEPITYDYSTKALLQKIDARSAESATILNGGVSVDNLSDDLRNAFYYRYADFGAVWENGFYINTSGARVELTSGNVATVSVLAGERYKIASANGSELKAYVFVDGDDNISYYPTERVSTRFETVTFVAPSDGTLYAQSYNGANYSIVKALGVAVASDGDGLAGKTWYALGDSITAYANGYHSIIAEKTGVEAINGGVSGSGYMKPINNRTFVDRSQLTEVYDIVTVFGSVNDMQYVADHLGTATDTGTETLGGCFNSVITNLYASGNYHIGIISPIPQGSTAGNPANTSGSFAQYTALLEEVCKLRGVPYLDLWHCSNMQPWDTTFAETYMLDNTHPNADGHAIFAPRIKAFIESL